MTHDPMCPIVDRRYYSATCVCDLIARIRADEREKADCPDPSICDRHNCAAAAAYCDGVSDERERAAEVIYTIYKAAFPMTDYEVGYCAGARASRDAVAAARGGDA